MYVESNEYFINFFQKKKVKIKSHEIRFTPDE